MRILLIGNPDSIFIKNLCEYAFLDENNSIEILNRSPGGYIGRYSEFYSKSSINVINPYTYIRSFFSVPVLSGILLMAWLDYVARKQKKYDICFIEYATKVSCDFVARTYKQYGRIVISYWGSDLLRANKKTIEAQKRLIDRNSIISFGCINLRKSFEEKFGNQYNDKFYVIPFPIPNLDLISCKQSDGSGKINIAIGYSASEAQHHIQIIDSIGLLDETTKKRIKLYLLMSYGGSKEYIEKVRLCAEGAGTDFEIQERFLSPEEMAEYCESIDIYIHGIETDAFSASMLEMIAGGAVVIKGEWLKYDELDNMGVTLINVRSYNQIEVKIRSILEDYPNQRRTAVSNAEKIRMKYTTQTIKYQYHELIRKK